MNQLHMQASVVCNNVLFDGESRIINLTGNSSNSLVERGAVIQGGSLNNSIVSGRVVLVNCEVSNATITGNGFRRDCVIDSDIRICDKRTPRKRVKFEQALLFPIETAGAVGKEGAREY